MSDGSTNSLEYASLRSKTDQTSSVYLSRPTIFDILAQENMHSLFRPAFNHLTKWLATVYPTWFFARLRAHSNEAYVLAHSGIEYLYLKEYGSLFSEYFYGLKRHKLETTSKRVLSVLMSVVVPYLKSKLDDYYEELEKTVDLSQLTARNEASKVELIYVKIKRILIKYYQYFHLFWSASFWYYRFRFMIDRSDFNSPLLSFLNLKLVYDLNRQFQSAVSNSSVGFVKRALQFFNYCFTNFLFFLQFIKWFYDYRENRSYESLPRSASENETRHDEDDIIKEPTLPATLAENKAYKILNEKGLCPLCNKKRKNECALSVSGFVFCYPCIFRFIKEHNRCPLTNFPCTTKNIIRIYSTSTSVD